MSIDVELRMQRKQTLAFIIANPTSIILSRVDVVRDPSGGYVRSPPFSLPAQQMRLDPVATSTSAVRRTVDGIEVEVEFQLIAHYTADIRRGDWFYREGIKYEVVFVDITKADYETQAEVAVRG